MLRDVLCKEPVLNKVYYSNETKLEKGHLLRGGRKLNQNSNMVLIEHFIVVRLYKHFEMYFRRKMLI